MNAYSMDLRTRVVQAWEAGEGTRAQLAERFRLHVRTVGRWLGRYRATGSVAPGLAGGGRQAVFHGDTLDRLRRAVDETPDATLDELAQTCGVVCSRMAVITGLKKLNRRRKKKDPACQRAGSRRRESRPRGVARNVGRRGPGTVGVRG